MRSSHPEIIVVHRLLFAMPADKLAFEKGAAWEKALTMS